VGTGEKVLVSCSIIAIKRRMAVVPELGVGLGKNGSRPDGTHGAASRNRSSGKPVARRVTKAISGRECDLVDVPLDVAGACIAAVRRDRHAPVA